MVSRRLRRFSFSTKLGTDPAEPALDPDVGQYNWKAAVTNLFYFNNVIHDKLYKHGFTGPAGNFQEKDFLSGGLDGDSVFAEAQDGSGTNNANFATPADGNHPRMQMYVWTQTTPKRDGDLDSDIIWHEYGHGVTWRMVGNMGGPLAGAIGEGFGDVLAIYANRLTDSDATVAEYSYNNPVGIRRYSYKYYPTNMTYGDVTGNSVHADGEIYAATMWELLGLWLAASQSEDALYDVMIDGLNYTPPQPAFEQMRNGMIDAINFSTGNQSQVCLVWKAFAARGIGEGADGQVKQRGPFRYSLDITESLAEPSYCQTPVTDIAITSVSATPNPAVQDDLVVVSVTVENVGNQDVTANIIVTLVDDSATPSNAGDDQTIGMQTIFGGLAAGAFQTLPFNWQTTTSTTLGPHTLTASHNGADDDGTNNSGSTVVTVDAPSTGGIELMATGYKVKGVKHAELMWNGAVGTNVNVHRDGVSIAETANDGMYIDNSGQKGGGTFTYQVCETGTSTCSNEVTVTF